MTHYCRNAAPEDAKLFMIRATDVPYEQHHLPVQVEWPGQPPPQAHIAILDILSRQQHGRDLHIALGRSGIRASRDQTDKALAGALAYYGADTAAQATDRAFQRGDLGFIRSTRKPDSALRQVVAYTAQAWATRPKGPDNLNLDPMDAYEALGATFPPAFIRRSYEKGYRTPPPESADGWYHRRIFVPLTKWPRLNDKHRESLEAAANDIPSKEIPAGEHAQRNRIRQVRDHFSVSTARIASLSVALAIAGHEIALPDFDHAGVVIPSSKELEALSLTACGFDVADIGRAMQTAPNTIKSLLARGRHKLKARLTPAAIARLFAMDIFIPGRVLTPPAA